MLVRPFERLLKENYSLPDSSKELSRSSVICLVTSFSLTFFQKHLRIMVFTHFKNRDNQHDRYTNTIRTFFLAFYIIRVCVDSILILFLNFFLLYIGSLSNLFLITFLSLSQISLYFSSSFLPFIKKDIYLV